MAKIHSEIRLKQRYRQALTTSFKKALVKRIKDGKCKKELAYSNRLICTLEYNRNIYKLVYSNNEEIIITFLPMTRYEIDQYRKELKKNEV